MHPESWRRCQTAAAISKYKISTDLEVFKRMNIKTVVINYEDNNKYIGDCEGQNLSVKKKSSLHTTAHLGI
jgi:hypothetical protein